MPFISVVIPTYNNAHFLTGALDSVFAQTFRDYEVIVVDDGSTDDTRSIVSRYGDRVIYRYQENQGLAVARNTGLEMASAPYLSYLDADDLWEPDNLLAKSLVVRAHPEVGGVFSEFAIFDDRGAWYEDGMRRMFPFFDRTRQSIADVFEHHETVEWGEGARAEVYRGRVFEQLFWGNFILPTSMVFGKAHAETVGTFRPELRTQQDYEYWLRFTRVHPLAYIDMRLVRYRRHAGQLTDYSRIERVLLAVHGIVDLWEEELVASGRGRDYARRKAGLSNDLAKVCIGHGRNAEARTWVRDALRHDRAFLPAYGSLAMTLLPYPMLSRLRGRRS